MPIKVSGVKHVNAKFDAYADTLDKSVTNQLKAFATRVYKKSQDYVPVDTGALKASGRIKMSRTKGKRGKKTFTVFYGGNLPTAFHGVSPTSGKIMSGKRGDRVDYAMIVHEWHKSPAKAKFLQRAIDEETPDFLKRIKESQRKAKKKAGL
jgi:hypothetical protein